MALRSSDGFQVLRSGKRVSGTQPVFATAGSKSHQRSFDAIVVGAGFAGLSAARDLAKAGVSVALLEARDRIGGRTYLAHDGTQKYELGGTWIHWTQPFVWREVEHYGLEIVESLGSVPKTISVLTSSGLTKGPAAEMGPMMDTALTRFCDIDGFNGAALFSRPLDIDAATLERFDRLSLTDRLDEMDLDELSLAMLSAFVSMNAGNHPDRGGLLDQLRWWALGGYSTSALLDRLGRFKLVDGTAALAHAMLEESQAELFLNRAVTTINQRESGVEISLADGDLFRAKAVISALPLNVLGDICFDPPLSPERAAAAQEGLVCRPNKFFAWIEGSLGPWLGLAPYPNPITMALSDREVDGKTLVIGFSPEGALDVTLLGAVEAELDRLLPGVKVDRLISHDWNEDPYARGAWTWFAPGQTQKYLAGLRQSTPPVLFANSDWAKGWRGFIDGAIEDGARCARDALRYLGD